MATDQDVRNARENGRKAGYDAAVAELRTFTGITYLSERGPFRLYPDLNQPEHLAYQRYRDELDKVIPYLAAEKDRMQEVVNADIDRAVAIETRLNARLKSRKDERSQSFVLKRAVGRIGDLLLREHEELRGQERLLEKRRERLVTLTDHHREARIERDDVTRWLEQAKASLANV